LNKYKRVKEKRGGDRRSSLECQYPACQISRVLIDLENRENRENRERSEKSKLVIENWEKSKENVNKSSILKFAYNSFKLFLF